MRYCLRRATYVVASQQRGVASLLELPLLGEVMLETMIHLESPLEFVTVTASVRKKSTASLFEAFVPRSGGG